MFLTDVSIGNRTTVLVLSLLIVVAGTYCYVTLPREGPPDVPIPIVLVSTAYEGVSPEDVESAVTMKIEKQLTGVKGVKEVTSTSAEGQSLVIVEFLSNVVIDDALQYVRDRVDLAKPDLPSDVEEPSIREVNIAEFPILIVNISGELSPIQLKVIADELEDAIEAVPGVLNVDVSGVPEREIRLELDPDRVASYNLTIPEIVALIPGENVNVSAGGLETEGTRFYVRVPAEIVDPDEVDTFVLATRNGKPIYLSDVATIRDTFKDRTSFSRLNGKPSITVAVQKRVGANIVRVAAMAKAILAEARRQAPPGVGFEVTLDQSKYVRMTVSDLENNIASGFVLVVAVLFIFMGWRASTIVALAIPMSMLLSFVVIAALDYTLNMVVLFGLVLAVGMLVDNAIVIVENIYRHQQLGYGRVQAAILGTREVAWPVTTSTATTVVAFLPLAFWPDVIGDFMKYLPITVIIALSSSLFIALVVNPTICSVVSGGALARPERDSWFIRNYTKVLRAAVEHRFFTLSASVALLLALAAWYVLAGQGVQFFPESDPDRALISIRSPQGTNVHESDRLARLVEERVSRYRQDYDYLITSVGSAQEGAGMAIFTGMGSGPHVANLTLVFKDYELRERPSAEVVAEIRRDLTDIAGAEVKVDKEQHGPPTGDPVTVRVIGPDFKVLEELSEKAKRMIAAVPGLVNLLSDLEAARPELVFRVDRRRARLLGVNTALVGEFLKMAIFGRSVGTYRQFNDEYDITVRLPLERRIDVQDVFALSLPNAAGEAVPLSSLGRFEYQGGFGTITHINRGRVVTLTAGAEGRLSTAVLADVQTRLSPLGQPLLTATEVTDWRSFCSLLARGESEGGANSAEPVLATLGQGIPVLRWFSNPGAEAEKVIRRCAETGEIDEAGKEAVVGALNRILGDRDFYSSEHFPKLELPVEARTLLSEARPRGWFDRLLSSLGLRKGGNWLTKEEAGALNRHLLETLYPTLLVKNEKLSLPPGYRIEYAGEKEEQDKAWAFLWKAFAVAIFLIVMILVIQFNSLKVPFIIMTTVVLSMVGVMAGLLSTRTPFGIIMTGIGVISLAGVVVNNAIVLLDYTRQLQQRGSSLVEAAVEAGRTRLRPVLLTAGTTLLGLIPMATGISYDFHTFQWVTRSQSSEMWRGMAVAVIFGLGFATVLTLVVVPTLYVALRGSVKNVGREALEKV